MAETAKPDLPARLFGEGSLGLFANMLKNNPQAAGIMGSFDKNSEGNPLNDLAGMAKGLFGKG